MMDFRWAFWGLILCLAVPGMTGAQTIYNAPNQETASPSPLNLRQLLRRDQASPQKSPAAVPYANAPKADNQNFQQRQSMLNQWRAQRDAQAWQEQADSTNYMAALSQSDNPTTFGMTPAPSPVSPSLGDAPTRTPMIYRKKDDPAIQKPRRLFNSIQ